MAEILVGTVGTAAIGVTTLEGADATLVPLLLVAVTVNVYGVPLVKFVMVHVVAGAVAVQLAPPGAAVAL